MQDRYRDRKIKQYLRIIPPMELQARRLSGKQQEL